MTVEKNESSQYASATPDSNEQVCVCYDVYRDEISEAIASGLDSVDAVSDATYACQGCGSCRVKVQELIDQQQEPQTEEKPLPRELEKNLNRNVCVCYDVTKQQIIDAYQNGATTFDEVVAKTYACQGSGCCERQVEKLVDVLNEHYPKT